MEINKALYTFIENYLRTEPCPIYSELTKKVNNTFNTTFAELTIAKYCNKISTEKNISFVKPTPRMTQRRRDYEKLAEAANKSGITSYEIYILHKECGYSFSTLSRIYYDLTGSVLSSDYFSEKFKEYCEQNGIAEKQVRGSRKVNTANAAAIVHDIAKHSEFFQKAINDTSGNSNSARREAAQRANDPYKHLKDDYER